MNKEIIPVVLAGGSGSRLWPLSRSAYPKQFLPLVKDEETLLQSTLLRLSCVSQAPIIVCHEDHRFIVAEQLREIGVKPRAIILEPAARNTAPAIALAAYYVKRHLPAADLWVMPADHVIHDIKALEQAMESAYPAIRNGDLVAFGIKAKHPETAYGYIKAIHTEKPGIFKIDRFVEKPDLPTAETYVSSGQYYWNCGIFA